MCFMVTNDSSAGSAASLAQQSTEGEAKKLKTLEERLRHELLDDEERLELSDRIIRLRRRLAQRS